MWCRERRKLRAQQGLDASEKVIQARCSLRPGVAGDAVCEKADDGFAIRGAHLPLSVMFSLGCAKTCNVFLTGFVPLVPRVREVCEDSLHGQLQHTLPCLLLATL